MTETNHEFHSKELKELKDRTELKDLKDLILRLDNLAHLVKYKQLLFLTDYLKCNFADIQSKYLEKETNG
jgi:hypothetical protein